MTEDEAVAIWTANVHDIRMTATSETQQVYDRWLWSDMGNVERDNAMRAIRAKEDAAIEAAKRLYRANRALAAA